MKEPFSEEILSAYIDGELPPREHAEVEQWLEDSPEARQKLDDFRRLSTLFASLPRTEIAREFPTKVLQLAERRMLLPEAAAVSARRRFHRRILAVGGAIASAAAVLFVTVHFRDPGVPQRMLSREGDPALPESVAPNRPIDGGKRGAEQPAGKQVAGNDRTPAARTMLLPAAPSVDDLPEPGIARPGTAAPEDESGATIPRIASGGSLKKSAAKMADSRSPKEDGTPAEGRRPNPRIAEFSREMDRLGDADADDEHLSVVTIRIDHADGMTLVQKILVNNDVLPAGIREAQEKGDEEVGVTSRSVAGVPADDLTECLIVIAEPERVIAALNEIVEREDAAIRVTVEAPLEIAALDAVSQKLLKQSDGAGRLGGSAMPRRDAAAPAARSADKAEERVGSGKGGGDTVPGADAAKSDKDANLVSDAPANSDNKKTAETRRGESGKSVPSTLRKNSPGADNGLAKRKEAAARPDSNRAAMGQARQFVVPVPKEIESRQLTATAAKPEAGRNTASQEIPATPAPKAASQPSADGKAEEESKQARRTPSLVRVLFVIEPTAARPSAPDPSGKGPSGKEPAGKGSSGGAL